MSLKPTLRKSGSKHVTLRVRFDPSRQTTVETVAAQLWDETTDAGANPEKHTTRTAVENALRDSLMHHGIEWYMGAGDELAAMDNDGEDALEWAEREVSRLFPEWDA